MSSIETNGQKEREIEEGCTITRQVHNGTVTEYKEFISNKQNTECPNTVRQVRSGTVNEGYEYEKLIPAYFALKLLLDQTVKSFDFELNSRSFRKFDDLILTVTKSDNTEEKFAIQLKHRDEEHRRLKANDEFNKRKSNFKEKGFNISQFLRAYADEDRTIRESYKFVLFTNVEFVGLDEVRNYLVKEVKNAFGTDLFNVDGTYQFKEQYAREFCKNFFLISAQKSVNEVHNSIVEIFSKEFHSDEQTAIYYINFFQQLRNNNYTNTRITRDSVVLNLTKFLASRSFIAPSLTSEDEPKVGLVENAIKNFDLTVLEDVDKEFVKKYWKSVVTRTTDQDTNLARDLKFLQKNEIFPKRMSPIVVSIIMNKPLFLEVNTNNEKVVFTVVLLLKTLENFKLNVVLVGRVVPKSRFPNFNIFESLTDLKPFKSLYTSFIQTIKVSFQGRESQTLQFIKSYVKIDQLITSSEIFKSLQGDLHFGEDIEDLPKFFIPRTLLKSDVNLDQLKIISTQSTTMVHCGGKSKEFRTFLQAKTFDFDIDNPRIILTDDEDYQNEYHHLTLTEDGTLMWTLQKIDVQTWNIFDNSLNLLSGGTGVGKTTMMKYLAQNCPVGYWVSRVPMQQMGSVFKKENDIDDVLEQLLVNTKRSKVDDRVCEYFRQTGRILFLFDGLNELNSNAIREALGVIKKIAQKGYKIWISGNRNLPEYVGGLLELFHSYTVQDLNIEDQKNYVSRRLQSSEVNEETIKKIFEKLFETKKEDDILKLPLILYILTHNFSISEDLTNWEKELTLHHMYSNFTQGQLQHNLEKTGITKLNNVTVIIESFKNYHFNGYQIAGLQMCLEPENFAKLNIKMDPKFLKIIKDNGDFLHFVKVNKDETFSFSHRTFGEYFAAMWLSKNFWELEPEDRCLIFREEYEGIRRFFDAKLAEDCPLHLAVLDNDVVAVRKYSQHVNDKDKGGRTPLHLVASLGRKHKVLKPNSPKRSFFKSEKNFTKQEEILRVLLLLGGDPLELDHLFGWNSFEYASATSCYHSLEELSKKQPLEWRYLNSLDIFTLSYYSVTTPYINLLVTTINNVGFQALDAYHKDDPLLNLALGANQKEVASFLIEKGASLTTPDSLEQTPLHKAASWGHTPIVRLLLNHVHTESHDVIGRTPLQLAAKMGHQEVVTLLVDKGAEIEARDSDSKTAIQRAACNGHTKIVAYLLEKGANINAFNIDRKNSLHRAAEMGHSETVNFLVKAGINLKATDKYKRTALHFAAAEGHEDVVQVLLRENFDLLAEDEDEKTPRDLAEGRGHKTVATILKEAEKKQSPKVANNEEEDIFEAAKTGSLENVERLLSMGVDIDGRNHDNETILHIAAAKGHYNLVKFLLSKNANTAATNNLDRVPLHHACLGGNVSVVQELLNRGQNNTVDGIGLIPLHRAAFKGHLQVVKVLIENGADPNGRSLQDLTSLHSASLGGRNKVIEFLISAGADIKAKNCRKETCLHIAVLENWPETVEYLVDNQKEIIDEVDASGMTALYFAAQKGNKEMVQSLVRGGADVNITDNLKRSALDAARSAGKLKIVEILQNC